MTTSALDKDRCAVHTLLGLRAVTGDFVCHAVSSSHHLSARTLQGTTDASLPIDTFVHCSCTPAHRRYKLVEFFLTGCFHTSVQTESAMSRITRSTHHTTLALPTIIELHFYCCRPFSCIPALCFCQQFISASWTKAVLLRTRPESDKVTVT